MSGSTDSVRLAWLSAALGEKRNLVIDLFARMRGMVGKAVPGAIKASLFPKFLALMDQISDARDEEMRIINRIQAVEAKHRFRRKTHALKAVTKDQNPVLVPDSDAERPKNDILWLAAMWYMLTGPGISKGKQDLTVD